MRNTCLPQLASGTFALSLCGLLCFNTFVFAQAPAKTPTLVLPPTIAPSGTPPAPQTELVRAPAKRSAASAAATQTDRSRIEASRKALREQFPRSGPVDAAPANSRSARGTGTFAVAQVVQPANGTPIQSEIITSKVIQLAGGAEQLVPANNLQTGDVIQFSARFSNLNVYAIKFDPQISVPPQTKLIESSISPPSGKLVQSGGKAAVAWQVPHLPSLTWVGASMRVRYEAPPLTVYTVRTAAPAAATVAAPAPVPEPASAASAPETASSAPSPPASQPTQ